MTESPWMTPEELAAYMKVSTSYAYQLISEREIESCPLRTTKTDRKARPPVRIHKNAADAFIMRHRREAVGGAR